jgi:hypothetical protein
MPDKSYELCGVRVLECAAEGPQPRSDRDAVEIIGSALREGAVLVVIPAVRLGDDFFRLKTRVAGEIVQKFVTYRRGLVIVGDISGYVSESEALRDFVYECNRGSRIWFVEDMKALEARLAREFSARQ